MKRKISKFIIGMSIFGVGLVSLPMISSCSDIDDLQKVDRGDGTVFASYGDNFKITFNDQIVDAMTSQTSYSEFKKQYANQLLHNFYKKIVDSEKIQSFNDNWLKWNNDIDDEYDEKVKESKEKNGSKWQFYFQNEVLDPVGGTKEAWKYNQLCAKIREDFKTKVFVNDYLAYSNKSEYNVNNDIVSTFDKEIFFEHPDEWKKINFYARNKSGGNYNTDRDLDDIYAIIQKLAFEMYTGTNHPFSVSMCLWKYKNPTSSKGLLDVYSDKINDNDKSSAKTDDGDDDGGDENPSITDANYAFPAFPEYNGNPSANGKFWFAVKELLLNDSNYGLLTNSGFSNIINDKWYTDDSATQIIVESSDLGSLDAVFGGAAVNLWAVYSNSQYVTDKFLKYDISNLLANPDVATNTDILRNFFFRSNDKRLFDNDGNLTKLGMDLASCENKIDLSKIYESVGNEGKLDNDGGSDNFHSKIFRLQSPLFFDYYGEHTSEGGVQWVVPALRLYDGTKPLPYILIRDEISEGGVHIIGLNGASYFSNDDEQSGYLKKQKSANNDNTDPFSQGRENILLKAQYLWDKTNSSPTFKLDSKIKNFFEKEDNMNDIIISMAKNKTKRENDDQTIIFDDEGLLDNVDHNPFYELFSLGNNFFSTQSTITAIETQNKRLFNTKFANVKKSISSRSDSLSKITNSNYSNGMSTPYPFAFVEPTNEGYVSSLVSYDVNSILAWKQCDIYAAYNPSNDKWNRNEIKFSNVQNIKSNYISQVRSLTQNITPNIQKSKPGKYSEYIYNEWNQNDALSVAIYAVLESYGKNDTLGNNVKIKAMKNYASSIFNNDSVISSFDSFNGYATFKDKSLNRAFISRYITNELLSSDRPIPLYQSNNWNNSIDNYALLLEEAFKNNLSKSYQDINYNSKMYDYLLTLDAIQYLVKDNYANLIDYLKKNVIRYGEDGNIVWIAKEDTVCVPTFNNDNDENSISGEINSYFNLKPNYYGQYSNTYFNNAGENDKPDSYVANEAYYRFAPVPVGNKVWTDAMGYVGLVTITDSMSPITSTISDQIFKNAYYAKRKSNGENDRYGGWYKYGSYNTLLEKIDICSGVKDLTDLVNNLASDLLEPDFTRNVKTIVSRSFYEDGDPEVEKGDAKVGDPISLAVLKKRMLGEESLYYEKGWGLKKYEEDHKTLISNMFKRFGDGESVAEICNSDDIQKINHTIRISNDETHVEARVLVMQLNNNDVSSYDNLYAALGNNKQLINMLVLQYAMNSSIQNLALQDVIKENFNGEKITVYDRRFNDKLGRVWVKDWKSTN